ncbi:hypothetical protein HAX54_037732, partial [Datura stramonium]|nr:hypothetical protein [Datura stramonium]
VLGPVVGAIPGGPRVPMGGNQGRRYVTPGLLRQIPASVGEENERLVDLISSCGINGLVGTLCGGIFPDLCGVSNCDFNLTGLWIVQASGVLLHPFTWIDT